MGDRRPEVVLFMDGGCTTPHPSKPGGWAAILMAVADRLAVPLAPLIDPRTGRLAVEDLSGRARGTTSNRMEVEGVIHGLRRIRRAGTTILVVADSEYVVETMQGEKRRVKNLDLWAELDAVAAGHDVRWEHTNGHGAGVILLGFWVSGTLDEVFSAVVI